MNKSKSCISLLTSAALLLSINHATAAQSADLSVYVESTSPRGDDGISVAADGSLYLSQIGAWISQGNFTGNSLVKVNSDKSVSTISDQLAGPNGSEVDSKGNVVVANINSREVLRFDSAGDLEVIAKFNTQVNGIAIDSADNIYVTHYLANRISKISVNGDVTVVVDDARLNGPLGIVVTEDDELYAGSYNDGSLFKVSSGSLTEIADIDGSNAQGLGEMGFLGYASGHFYATALGTDKIYQISKSGVITELAELKHANGIAGMINGKELYVTAWNNPQTANNTKGTIYKLTLQPEPAEIYSDYTIAAQSFDAEYNQLHESAIAMDSELPTASNLQVITQASNGTVTLSDNSVFSYQPNSGFSGVDTFSISAVGNNLMSRPAVITVNVAADPATPEPEPDTTTDTDTGNGNSAGTGVEQSNPTTPAPVSRSSSGGSWYWLSLLVALFATRRRI